MVATTAPPPSTADIRASNCEMLTNEPTTSSGDGMAKAGPVPEQAERECGERGCERKNGSISDGPNATKDTHLQIPSSRSGQQPGGAAASLRANNSAKMCRISR